MKVFSLLMFIQDNKHLLYMPDILELYKKDDGRECVQIGGSYVDGDSKSWNAKYMIDKKQWRKYEKEMAK